MDFIGREAIVANYTSHAQFVYDYTLSCIRPVVQSILLFFYSFKMARIRYTFLATAAILFSLLLFTSLWTPHVDAAKKEKTATKKQQTRSNTASDTKSFELKLSEMTVEVSNPKDKTKAQKETCLLHKVPVGTTDDTGRKGVRAHQAFIIFRPQPSTIAANNLGNLAQVFQSTISGKHRFNMIANRFVRYFSRQPGTYDVEVILGIFGEMIPIRYKLGTIKFDFPPADPTDPSFIDEEAKRVKQRKLEGPDDAEYKALPEIVHQFRSEERMPPIVFSLGYSAVVLSPWFVLLGLWQWIGIKPNQLPKTATASIAHLLFFGCIAGFISLYAAYWIKLRLLQTMAYAVPLTLFTVLATKSE
ncbi:Oligosaccharyltransferase subunit Ribophorin II-domain-containing protein [Syncephalis fuscata]|nr:Oligosaccharyltransferase subunit Ribophorin II-domain-containing protein [Syncephalis fuscata]